MGGLWHCYTHITAATDLVAKKQRDFWAEIVWKLPWSSNRRHSLGKSWNSMDEIGWWPERRWWCLTSSDIHLLILNYVPVLSAYLVFRAPTDGNDTFLMTEVNSTRRTFTSNTMATVCHRIAQQDVYMWNMYVQFVHIHAGMCVLSNPSQFLDLSSN